MTTAQARRRRERAIIVGIAITMVLIIVSSWQNQRRDDDERQHNAKVLATQSAAFQRCITDVVHDLTTSLNARAQLSDVRSGSIQTLISDLLKAGNSKAKGEAAVLRYQKTQVTLKNLTNDHPIPPFPSGKCNTFKTKADKARAQVKK